MKTLGDLICRSVASADDVQPLIPVTGSRYLIDWANVARRGIGRRFFLESLVFSDGLTAVMPAISGIYPPGNASVKVAMRPRERHPKRWLRYVTSAAVAVWLLGITAGCHLPHSGHPALHGGSVLTAAGKTMVAESPHRPSAGVDCCSVGLKAGTPLMPACRIPDLVALDLIVTVVAMVASLAGPVRSTTRGPPRPVDVVVHQSGQAILTRLCISRR